MMGGGLKEKNTHTHTQNKIQCQLMVNKHKKIHVLLTGMTLVFLAEMCQGDSMMQSSW
jgi:hypothetical protein